MRTLRLVLTITLFAVPAAAAPLAPSKASQVFALRSSGVQGTCASTANHIVDEMVGPNGAQPFVIPPGQVFVVQSASFQGNGGGPLSSVDRHHSLEVLVVETNTILLGGGGAMADGSGAVSGAFSVSPGAVIKPGQTLCGRLSIGNAFVPPVRFRLYGFLAKDK